MSMQVVEYGLAKVLDSKQETLNSRYQFALWINVEYKMCLQVNLYLEVSSHIKKKIISRMTLIQDSEVSTFLKALKTL